MSICAVALHYANNVIPGSCLKRYDFVATFQSSRIDDEHCQKCWDTWFSFYKIFHGRDTRRGSIELFVELKIDEWMEMFKNFSFFVQMRHVHVYKIIKFCLLLFDI